MSAKRRYTVRRQSSGRTSSETFYVYDLVKKGRVTAMPHGDRRGAQADADDLEIAAMVLPHASDSRPYAIRHTEAAERFSAGDRARS